ncbi:MAG: haloalkane dehalogenase [Kofleriaceae bacterium]|nr:haloalkane dehalogenase [Myxococcales bacterium]MCB9572024.1 haloalkane dehalogenase [Kofleriaceae bacterium]
MEIVRTPDARFAALPDFPWAPQLAEVPSGDGGTLRMAYIDEGPRDAPAVLMLHGEPSWSFLYRHVIRAVVDAGLRAIAPDLIGFGRSDKPVARDAYSYQRHADWVRAFCDGLDVADLTLLCQDWGGLLGLRLAGDRPDRFHRIVAANTFLPTGDNRPPEAFFQWRNFALTVPELPVGRIVAGGCVRPVAPEVVAAYDAPFPDETFKAGARVFPGLVPVTPDDPASAANRAAWQGLTGYRRPFLCAFSDGDPITRGADQVLRARIPGAEGQPHTTIARAGHFLQEDAGADLGKVVVDFIAATPRA